MGNEAAQRKVMEKLNRDIDQAMVAAFDSGAPYFAAEERFTEQRANPFEIRDIFEPHMVSVSRRAGAVYDLDSVPSGYLVAKRPDDWEQNRAQYLKGYSYAA